ncbi:hypothetical protein EV697_103251 [Bisgaardia hudsonensis]|uniref:Lipoprotein n=1 Tax=Bisgaardia hudsonensis TaxID=109472 RepID=A0A4R2N0K8_9PAST|nr:NF038104 family lipoprotein [Bisgaardia hudsonensis]TCP12942.1 hypothetical protein EV697_103251 [Bisgaardia hudsonensis]
MFFVSKVVFVMLSLFCLSGCIVTSAVGLAVDTVTTVGSVAVKTVGAVADAAIPDKED